MEPEMRTSGKANFIPATLAILFLASCGGILESKLPADRTFWLTPLAEGGSDAPVDGPALSVSVDAVPGLDSDRMLTLSPDSELNHFSGARWPDHLPEFAGSLLRRSLGQSGRFSLVLPGADAWPGACGLGLVINDFYTLVDGNGSADTVVIRVSGAIRCGASSRPLEVEVRRRVSGGRLVDVVAAHQSAMDEMQRQLLSDLDAYFVGEGAGQ
jgi:ABC-type uncharacterized transport system auxiliary subunit